MEAESNQGSKIVRINLSLSREAAEMLIHLTAQRHPGREKVQSLTVEELIREEEERIRRREQERKKREEQLDL